MDGSANATFYPHLLRLVIELLTNCHDSASLAFCGTEDYLFAITYFDCKLKQNTLYRKKTVHKQNAHKEKLIKLVRFNMDKRVARALFKGLYREGKQVEDCSIKLARTSWFMFFES